MSVYENVLDIIDKSVASVPKHVQLELPKLKLPTLKKVEA